ncbi:AAA family ATPase [Arthrobacter sp. E3]|uniref:AAA family ATPase n=1 Tax=Arthrobacter sp. E3 TaxID=517402 RepID=UPI001A94BC94|nr:AAA family ATPase [Arthrobacter sp. E3]
MSVWSRPFRSSAEKKAPVSEVAGPNESSLELQTWLAGLDSYSGADTALAFTKTEYGSISLTHAHPSGLAQLLAGRKTRLSTLIREPELYAAAKTAAAALRAKIFELSTDRGIDVGYLAAGIARWSAVGGPSSGDVCAPVLLAAVALTVRPGQDDYEFQLMEQAQVNPALVKYLAQHSNIHLDAPALGRLAYSTARFDPAPVLDRVRTLLAPIAGAEVEHELIVSTFAFLADNLNDPALMAGSPLLELLQSHSGDDVLPVELEPDFSQFDSLDERDPKDELLVLDADPQQQYVLDMVRNGESVLVSTPPGTGQTQTAINAIAALVHDGKSVLVVGERRGTLNELAQIFGEHGLDSLLLQLSAQTGPQQIKSQLIRAITRNEKAEEPKLGSLHELLVDHRHQLVDHVASLHNVRERWGCSPYEAMQSLAQLTSIHPAPSTTVRLKRSVLDSIRDRTDLKVSLGRAADLGAFSRAAVSSAWHGARMVTRKETETAYQLAEQLLTQVPDFATKMHEVAEFGQIRQGHSFAEWGRQLNMLVAIRESLDKFSADIFDWSTDEMIAATATSAWRKEHRVEMPALQRARFRRNAKDLVRPGVHIADLHASLLLVKKQSVLWAKAANGKRHPTVPSGLADLSRTYMGLREKLLTLGAVLDKTVDGGDLLNFNASELVGRLEALVASKESLETLPERTLLVEGMREQGLGELLDDLARREVPAGLTGPELELAWWQSALEAMISGDEYLAMSDGENLRRLEAEFRIADQAHVASGPGRIRWRLARRWAEVLVGGNRQGEMLRNVLKDGRVSLAALSAQAPDLLRNLAPVFVLSPLVVPTAIPEGLRFDAVVILDAEATSLQSALPALARAEQVVAFGDEQTACPKSFSVAVSAPGSRGADQHPLESVFGALSRVLPRHRLTIAYRSVDEDLVRQLSSGFYDSQLECLPDGRALTGLDRSLTVDYLPDGKGLPSSDGVESVVAEVNRVVDLVFEHARIRPLESLAIITASERHAVRVAQAIRVHMANHPMLADFFASGPESFRVVTVDRAAGLVRDRVIFSLGYGRTPHGRALHGLGPLSEPDGRAKFALAMTRARSHIHIVTCFRAEDLDESRLSHGAVDLFELLNRELAGNSLLGTPATRAQDSERETGEDPLVADLADRLHARGARVWHHYDGALDMAAAPDPIQLLGREEQEIPVPVAVESDGTAKYRNMSVRERSRLRPQMLERLGWRYVSLWTIEVFTDPSSCADEIGRYLGLPSTAGDADLASLIGTSMDTSMTAVMDSPRSRRRSGTVTPSAEDATSNADTDNTDSAASDDGSVAGTDDTIRDDAGDSTETQVCANDVTAQTDNATADGSAADNGSADNGAAAEAAAAAKENDESVPPMSEEAGDQGSEGKAVEAESKSAATPATPSIESEVLPKEPPNDAAHTWGDNPEDRGHDAWLRENKPPHWG